MVAPTRVPDVGSVMRMYLRIESDAALTPQMIYHLDRLETLGKALLEPGDEEVPHYWMDH